MQIELRCPSCPCVLAAPPETPALEILERMTNESPWFGLADGDTFEDMIFHALLRRGRISCPECGTAVLVQEESLGELLRNDFLACGI
jgi:hypothetical protein